MALPSKWQASVQGSITPRRPRQCKFPLLLLTAYLHHLETLVPEFEYAQPDICESMKRWLPEKRTRRYLDQIYKRSGIDTRYCICENLFSAYGNSLYGTDAADGRPRVPSTFERNQVYTEAAKRLSIELGRKLFAGCTGKFSPADVTHIVYASCTGFCNPGPEFYLARELGIPDSAERYTLGFMGCYAAFPALRMAAQFCEANPEAVVLVMCLELSSLHMQISSEPDSLLGNSLFADGAGAAIVSGREPAEDRNSIHFRNFSSAVVESGEADMAWTIGNSGFDLVLSSYVPKVLGAEIRDLVPDPDRFQKWAVHPGGRAILDKVEKALELPEQALDSSREVLRKFGNMSSATILFVLKHLLNSTDQPGEFLTHAMAFGPGLTVETAELDLRIRAAKPKNDRTGLVRSTDPVGSF
ncbi:MAG: type III polyketide synthase [Verrucomicrobiales bacterium]|nr:type III polyketide synthase [Verrucomicrobiales bacterium]